MPVVSALSPVTKAGKQRTMTQTSSSPSGDSANGKFRADIEKMKLASRRKNPPSRESVSAAIAMVRARQAASATRLRSLQAVRPQLTSGSLKQPEGSLFRSALVRSAKPKISTSVVEEDRSVPRVRSPLSPRQQSHQVSQDSKSALYAPSKASPSPSGVTTPMTSSHHGKFATQNSYASPPPVDGSTSRVNFSTVHHSVDQENAPRGSTPGVKETEVPLSFSQDTEDQSQSTETAEDPAMKLALSLSVESVSQKESASTVSAESDCTVDTETLADVSRFIDALHSQTNNKAIKTTLTPAIAAEPTPEKQPDQMPLCTSVSSEDSASINPETLEGIGRFVDAISKPKDAKLAVLENDSSDDEDSVPEETRAGIGAFIDSLQKKNQLGTQNVASDRGTGEILYLSSSDGSFSDEDEKGFVQPETEEELTAFISSMGESHEESKEPKTEGEMRAATSAVVPESPLSIEADKADSTLEGGKLACKDSETEAQSHSTSETDRQGQAKTSDVSQLRTASIDSTVEAGRVELEELDEPIEKGSEDEEVLLHEQLCVSDDAEIVEKESAASDGAPDPDDSPSVKLQLSGDAVEVSHDDLLPAEFTPSAGEMLMNNSPATNTGGFSKVSLFPTSPANELPATGDLLAHLLATRSPRQLTEQSERPLSAVATEHFVVDGPLSPSEESQSLEVVLSESQTEHVAEKVFDDRHAESVQLSSSEDEVPSLGAILSSEDEPWSNSKEEDADVRDIALDRNGVLTQEDGFEHQTDSMSTDGIEVSIVDSAEEVSKVGHSELDSELEAPVFHVESFLAKGVSPTSSFDAGDRYADVLPILRVNGVDSNQSGSTLEDDKGEGSPANRLPRQARKSSILDSEIESGVEDTVDIAETNEDFLVADDLLAEHLQVDEVESLLRSDQPEGISWDHMESEESDEEVDAPDTDQQSSIAIYNGEPPNLHEETSVKSESESLNEFLADGGESLEAADMPDTEQESSIAVDNGEPTKLIEENKSDSESLQELLEDDVDFDSDGDEMKDEVGASQMVDENSGRSGEQVLANEDIQGLLSETVSNDDQNEAWEDELVAGDVLDDFYSASSEPHDGQEQLVTDGGEGTSRGQFESGQPAHRDNADETDTAATGEMGHPPLQSTPETAPPAQDEGSEVNDSVEATESQFTSEDASPPEENEYKTSAEKLGVADMREETTRRSDLIEDSETAKEDTVSGVPPLGSSPVKAGALRARKEGILRETIDSSLKVEGNNRALTIDTATSMASQSTYTSLQLVATIPTIADSMEEKMEEKKEEDGRSHSDYVVSHTPSAIERERELLGEADCAGGVEGEEIGVEIGSQMLLSAPSEPEPDVDVSDDSEPGLPDYDDAEEDFGVEVDSAILNYAPSEPEPVVDESFDSDVDPWAAEPDLDDEETALEPAESPEVDVEPKSNQESHVEIQIDLPLPVQEEEDARLASEGDAESQAESEPDELVAAFLRGSMSEVEESQAPFSPTSQGSVIKMFSSMESIDENENIDSYMARLAPQDDFFHKLTPPEGASSEEIEKLNSFIKVAAPLLNGDIMSVVEEAEIRVAARRVGISAEMIDGMIGQSHLLKPSKSGLSNVSSQDEAEFKLQEKELNEIEDVDETEDIHAFLSRVSGLKEGGDDAAEDDVDVDAQRGLVVNEGIEDKKKSSSTKLQREAPSDDVPSKRPKSKAPSALPRGPLPPVFNELLDKLAPPEGASPAQIEKLDSFIKVAAPLLNGDELSIVEEAEIRVAAARASIPSDLIDKMMDHSHFLKPSNSGLSNVSSRDDLESKLHNEKFNEMEEVDETENIQAFLSRMSALREGGHFGLNAEEKATAEDDVEIDVQHGFVNKKNVVVDDEEDWWEDQKTSSSSSSESQGGKVPAVRSEDSELDQHRGKVASPTNKKEKPSTPNRRRNETPERVKPAPIDTRRMVVAKSGAAGFLQSARRAPSSPARSVPSRIPQTMPNAIVVRGSGFGTSADLLSPSSLFGVPRVFSDLEQMFEEREARAIQRARLQYAKKKWRSPWTTRHQKGRRRGGDSSRSRISQTPSYCDPDDVSVAPSISGVAAASTLGRWGARKMHGRKVLLNRDWRLNYSERTRSHRGYFNVDVYSLYDASMVIDDGHYLDRDPWEDRDVRQNFLHEKSISFSRNWFGDVLRKRGNDRYKEPVSHPKSMEMPTENRQEGEWTEEWYTTWQVRNDPNYRRKQRDEEDSASSSSGGSGSFSRDEYTNYTERDDYTMYTGTAGGSVYTGTVGDSVYTGTVGGSVYTDQISDRYHSTSHSQFEDDETWEDPPECGTLENVKLKIGERVSRVHPDHTSNIRRSRWRKKYFPRGTFPYK